jgi:prephenate dehydrogenase
MKIAVLGTGKMGGWLAKELAEDGHEVYLYDIDASRSKATASACGGKVIASLDELQTVKPNMLVNAVGLENTVSAFGEVEKHLGKECIICDMASIKGEIPKYYEKSGRKFASVHPMFGPTFANVEALAKENMVIIKESCQEGREFFEKLGRRLGLNLFNYTFIEHDQMMAYSLTLPFASTMVFAGCMDSKAVPGTTFRKHMTIAKGLLSEEDNLLTEILFNKYSLAQLEKVTARLEFLKHVIKGKDREEAKRFFDKLRKNVG